MVNAGINKSHRIARPCWLTVIILLAAAALSAQEESAGEPSKIDAMIKVLVSDTAEMSLRTLQARALLDDSQAHQALIDILQNDGDLSAKTIICRAMAKQRGNAVFRGDQVGLTPDFIDPLFSVLRRHAPNSEISEAAASALARFENDGVCQRLAHMTADPNEPTAQRLAGIATLELMPGRAPVLALGALLADDDPNVRQRAADALTGMLALPTPITAQQFNKQYRDALQAMDERTFLSLQLAHKRKQLADATTRIDELHQQIDFWRSRYLQRLTAEGDRLTDPQQKLLFLREHLHRPDDAVRVWAMGRLETFCRGAAAQTDPVVQPLLELLTARINDSDPQVRRLTATALARLGKKARPSAANLLAQLLIEQQPAAQAALLEALGDFEYVQAIDSAVNLLDSNELAVVTQAAQALGKITAGTDTKLQEDQLKRIAQALAATYHATKPSVDVIRAMGRIAEQDRYRLQCQQYFDPILRQALGSHDPDIRTVAVNALTALYREQVLLLAEPKVHLNDSEARVRYAVLSAIKQFGGKDELPLLHQRLADEDNADVAQAIREAFERILTDMPIELCYSWSSRHNPQPTEQQQALQDKVADIFLEKVRHAQRSGAEIPRGYVLHTYTQQAKIATRKDQSELAVHWYSLLIELPDDQVPTDRKDMFRRTILELALDDHRNLAMLANGKNVMPALVAGPSGPQVLQLVEQFCDAIDKNDDADLHRGAEVLATLIVPVVDKIPSQFQQSWNERIQNFALEIIEHQERRLADQGDEDSTAIKLLQRLDPRLKEYPSSEAPLSQRRDALKKFHQIIKPTPQPDSTPDEPPSASQTGD